jgi:predicted DNA-binding WGR domain protein
MCDIGAISLVKPIEFLERKCYIMDMTLLTRVCVEENMRRWYLVFIQATLFFPCAVIIAWGRRDNDFQQWRAIPVDTPDQASQLAAKIVERKIKRGYQVQMDK